MSTTYLTVPQLCERWHCSRDYLRRLRKSGKGPAFTKLNANRVLYRLDDVETYEAQHRQETQAA
jgi:hypothetical protein